MNVPEIVLALEAKDKTREPCPVEGAGDVGMAEASEHPTRPRCSQGGGAPEFMVGSNLVCPSPC